MKVDKNIQPETPEVRSDDSVSPEAASVAFVVPDRVQSADT